MEAGNMDRLVTFQEATYTKEPSGQKVPTWGDISTRPTVWAQVQRDKGRENWSADKKTAIIPNKFKVHYRDDLHEAMTMLFEGKRFDINAIQEIPRRKGLLIFANWTQGQYDE